MLLTSDLRVGTLLTVANVNKIKRGFGLRKANKEVAEVRLDLYGALAFHGLCQTRKVGAHLGMNFELLGKLATLV